MNIKEFKLGSMPTNSQLIWDEKNVILFDCGGENLEGIKEFLEKRSLSLDKVIFTHGHIDHIGGLLKLKDFFPNVEVYIGEEEKEFFTNSDLSLANYLSKVGYRYEGEFKTVKEGDIINGFMVMDTPGHTRGGKSYYNRELGIVVVGDTMFKGSYGRHDLPTSNTEALYNSLTRLCNELPGDTKVYNGHTDFTLIKIEKANLTSRGII